MRLPTLNVFVNEFLKKGLLVTKNLFDKGLIPEKLSNFIFHFLICSFLNKNIAAST